MNSYVFDRLLDVPCYLFLMGFIEAVGLTAFAALALLWVPRRGWRPYARLVLRATILAFTLLAVGCVGNSIFMLVGYDRLYISADTVVDFYPFIPFGQWVLDATYGQSRGRLLGAAQMWQLQLLWALAATAVWVTTYWTDRAIRRALLSCWRRPSRPTRNWM